MNDAHKISPSPSRRGGQGVRGVQTLQRLRARITTPNLAPQGGGQH